MINNNLHAVFIAARALKKKRERGFFSPLCQSSGAFTGAFG
jgi:hypothetical protein